MHQAYKNCEGRSTPARDKLGSFLTFAPSTPEVIDQVFATDEPYTDNNYMNLIENVNGINNTYDDVSNLQSINLNFFKALTSENFAPSMECKANYVDIELPPLNDEKSKNYTPVGKGAARKAVSMNSGIKRNHSADDDDDNNDDDIGVNTTAKFFASEGPQRTIIKQKTRGRYGKRMSAVTKASAQQVQHDSATEQLFDEILQDQPSDMHLQNNRLFASHLLDTGYYMFLVVYDENSDDSFVIRYVNCVHSVYNEYVARHMHHDRFVFVVTYERYRFMISYKLLLHLEIDIPQQDQFSETQLNNTNTKECYFEEVKNFEFLTFLTNYFHLDKVYAQGKISLLLASIGEYKARLIYNTLTEMINDKSLFRLPFHMCKKEVTDDEVSRAYSSTYVSDIIRLTENVKFKVLPEYKKKHDRPRVINNVLKALSFWLRSKDTKSSEFKEKNNFTYKFGSVVRVLYDGTDKNVSKLFKIKKENGSVKLIEEYLSACKQFPESHNFMLVTTKSDERITVIKMGTEFIWITTVIKDIIVADIIKKYRLFNHHIFNLNTNNRKEINNRHNGLLKLAAFYTGQLITFDEMKSIAIESFNCNYDCKLHLPPLTHQI
ncbi:ie-1 [Mamestra brassicae multiple nucleopolyhedrovirus]|uniref:Ie-1 n=1 Tax=Mamestra brassicae nuclear polyhedrosis virus TaxID=78219 RepID=I3XMG9_NPVMB|nr:ie-1 [Mamestra brassicae multiple nucleopolyhedrovirus]AFL65002.1 ie-1 [Mamestra brassicae multiple nucleopolyhedrovirus]WRQ96726.1 ie-1 [Mamestra configurata nucleopolyhedrovirus B]WRQ96887.1 ie-1 [Mamestra configurata nucleopolyhedrovirus B]WRQ97048.1 ie1 [Mamestra configurata nucleopolyhedrovirus B]